ncbi:uracil phosphoribosyltransferase-domain-containing protein [Aspergillus californicus]
MDATTSSEPVNTHPPKVTTAIPQVIGLYGIPGCEKSYLMKQLSKDLGDSQFTYFEGSEVIQSITPGGLDAFKKKEEHPRRMQPKRDSRYCTGHFMFWSEERDEAMLRVYTEEDLDVYTHILYVNTPVEVTAKQRLEDLERNRSTLSTQHLQRWQDTEVEELRELCRKHDILFTTVYPNLKDQLSEVIRDFLRHGEDKDYNLSVAKQYLDGTLSVHYDKLQTVVMLDADKTLTPQDTGALFWERLLKSTDQQSDPLATLFSSKLGYSYTAFRQAMLLYEETTNDARFDAICDEVASLTPLYPQMSALLRHVLAREGLSEIVKVVGGGRRADGFVVTNMHKVYTWAIGDSPLDLPMLAAADQAIVVVGDERSGSKNMEDKLLAAMDNGLKARQALLPNDSSPRLSIDKLPIVDLTSADFVDHIIQHTGNPQHGLRLYEATDSAATKLLMTPMRDAALSGPPLREGHSEAGTHLARTILSEIIGIEEVPTQHVQGTTTTGYQLHAEKQTLIVALMRGGEAMAFGVNKNKAFPQAQFLHASKPEDIKRQHLENNITVILVDSVINNGKTVVEFVQFIRTIHASIRVVAVAGVVQDQAVSGCGSVRALARSTGLTVVALRLSKNKYTGRKGTDTENRLFNTAYLP